MLGHGLLDRQGELRRTAAVALHGSRRPEKEEIPESCADRL